MKVHDNKGFNTDPDVVLNRWKDDFNSLYNPPEEGLHYYKNKKAMGIDFIINEVLKHKPVIIPYGNVFEYFS